MTWVERLAAAEALMWACIAAAGVWFLVAIVIYGAHIAVERVSRMEAVDESLGAIRSVVETPVAGELHYHVAIFPGNHRSERFDNMREADHRAQELSCDYPDCRVYVRRCRKACA